MEGGLIHVSIGDFTPAMCKSCILKFLIVYIYSLTTKNVENYLKRLIKSYLKDLLPS